MWTFLFGLINPLSRIFRTIDAKIENETERQRIKSEAISRYTETMATTHRTAMGFKVFWIAWSLFAIPLGAWWAMVMFDTMFNFVDWQIPDLPQSVRPWANTIFENLFLSGAGGAAAQAIGSAIQGAGIFRR